MPPGHGFSCEGHFSFPFRSVNGWREAEGDAVPQAPRPPAAGCGERAPCRGNGRTSSAVRRSPGREGPAWRRRGRAAPNPDRPAPSHGLSRGCSCRVPAALSHRHPEPAAKRRASAQLRLRRPVPRRRRPSSRIGPRRGIARRAAGGRDRRAGAAPCGPGGSRRVGKDTRKQWVASLFRARGTGFRRPDRLAITLVIESRMSIPSLHPATGQPLRTMPPQSAVAQYLYATC